MLIGLTQLPDKLVFAGLTPDYLSLRTRPQPGVAIPRLEGKCIDNCPTERKILRFLVVIVTWFHSSGRLPHQCAHWFAMTAKTYKQQFVVPNRLSDFLFFRKPPRQQLVISGSIGTREDRKIVVILYSHTHQTKVCHSPGSLWKSRHFFCCSQRARSSSIVTASPTSRAQRAQTSS